jgi:hypothetical protein
MVFHKANKLSFNITWVHSRTLNIIPYFKDSCDRTTCFTLSLTPISYIIIKLWHFHGMLKYSKWIRHIENICFQDAFVVKWLIVFVVEAFQKQNKVVCCLVYLLVLAPQLLSFEIFVEDMDNIIKCKNKHEIKFHFSTIIWSIIIWFMHAYMIILQCINFESLLVKLRHLDVDMVVD